MPDKDGARPPLDFIRRIERIRDDPGVPTPELLLEIEKRLHLGPAMTPELRRAYHLGHFVPEVLEFEPDATAKASLMLIENANREDLTTEERRAVLYGTLVSPIDEIGQYDEREHFDVDWSDTPLTVDFRLKGKKGEPFQRGQLRSGPVEVKLKPLIPSGAPKVPVYGLFFDKFNTDGTIGQSERAQMINGEIIVPAKYQGRNDIVYELDQTAVDRVEAHEQNWLKVYSHIPELPPDLR